MQRLFFLIQLACYGYIFAAAQEIVSIDFVDATSTACASLMRVFPNTTFRAFSLKCIESTFEDKKNLEQHNILTAILVGHDDKSIRAKLLGLIDNSLCSSRERERAVNLIQTHRGVLGYSNPTDNLFIAAMTVIHTDGALFYASHGWDSVSQTTFGNSWEDRIKSNDASMLDVFKINIGSIGSGSAFIRIWSSDDGDADRIHEIFLNQCDAPGVRLRLSTLRSYFKMRS